MPDSTVFDDGVRLTSSVQLRVPPDLRDRMEAAAAAEGLTLAEYARRAIAERMLRTPAIRSSGQGEPAGSGPISQESSASPGGTESGGSGRHNHRA